MPKVLLTYVALWYSVQSSSYLKANCVWIILCVLRPARVYIPYWLQYTEYYWFVHCMVMMNLIIIGHLIYFIPMILSGKGVVLRSSAQLMAVFYGFTRHLIISTIDYLEVRVCWSLEDIINEYNYLAPAVYQRLTNLTASVNTLKTFLLLSILTIIYLLYNNNNNNNCFKQLL